MRSSKKIALSAIISALGVVVLFLGGLLNVLDITAACIVSFFVLFIYVEIGARYAVISYAVISLLGFLVCGSDLFAAFCFAGFFGPMAVTKFALEKLGKILSWICKILIPTALLALGWIFGAEVLGFPDEKWMRIVFFVTMIAVAVIVQLLYDRLLRIYTFRFRDRIKKYLQ